MPFVCGSFTVSMWMTKQSCNAQAGEVLFSHQPSDATSSRDMKDRSNPNLNIQLLCEQNGGGRAQYDESSIQVRCPTLSLTL